MITLTTEKSMTLQGFVREGDRQIVYMNAVISADADTSRDSISVNVQDKELYNANKNAIRAKIAEFQQMVWEEQDKLDEEDSVTED